MLLIVMGSFSDIIKGVLRAGWDWVFEETDVWRVCRKRKRREQVEIGHILIKFLLP